jgi:leader peptidase (prepilin peptidase)/N-methyltransferase
MTTVPASMVPLVPAAAANGWPVFGIGFVLGACVGSFLNVCIHRMPADESVVRPGSRCPGCGTPIAWYDNVPVLSWLWLGARCRSCREPIAARYPLVEIATGALAVLALAVFGPTLHAAIAFAFTAALLLVSVIDLDHRFIPDEVSLPGVLVGLAVAFLPGAPTPLDAALGAAVGGGVLWLVAWAYERATSLEGMGLGDVKLLAMIGAFVGWQAIPMILVVASVTGSIAGVAVMAGSAGRARGRRVVQRLGRRALVPFVRRAARRTEIPFGPFLAFAGALAYFFPALWIL